MKAKNVGILAVDFYVPPFTQTNRDLVDQYGPFYSRSGERVTTRGIQKKTGIQIRHVVNEEENSDLAVEAALRIINKAGVPPEQIDCCIIPSSTPQMLFPSTACLMQNKLRQHFPYIQLFPAFDLLAACAGSVYGLIIAQALVVAGTCQYVLVIGSEVLTKLSRWQLKGGEVKDGQKQKGDWETSVLFGDGAAGVLVGEVEPPSGFLAVDWGADGSFWEIARSDGFGTQFSGAREYEPHMFLNGSEVYKQAVRIMAEAAERVVEKAGISWQKVKWVILHQANNRMTQSIEKRVREKGLRRGRVPSNIYCYGNTSSASPFILLAEKETEGKIQKGDVGVISTAGSGLTWAAMALSW